MSEYRRSRVPGATYFFTVVTHHRTPVFRGPDAIALLRSTLRACRARWPFYIDAMVILPDHLHAMWTLPPDDANYSRRWAWAKKEFTKAWRVHRAQPGLRVWQPRFWEHWIRDEQDFARHADYIHYNPVKHGLVECPIDWPHSSFHRAVRQEIYPVDWGCVRTGAIHFKDLNQTAME